MTDDVRRHLLGLYPRLAERIGKKEATRRLESGDEMSTREHGESLSDEEWERLQEIASRYQGRLDTIDLSLGSAARDQLAFDLGWLVGVVSRFTTRPSVPELPDTQGT